MKGRDWHISILTIKQKDHRFTTIGDWKLELPDRKLTIWISEMPVWKWWISVLAHEVVEVAWCMYHGVSNQACDDFDAWYEKEYEAGRIPKSQEAGYDKRCPYRPGHVWGDRVSWVVDKLLRTDQKLMYEYFNKLVGVTE